MCERCAVLRDSTVPALIVALESTDDPTLELLARLVALAPASDTPAENLDQLREEINQAFLDTYPAQRRDAITFTSWLITRLHAIKQRLVHEAEAAGDRFTVTVQWQESHNGFLVTACDADGNRFTRFEPIGAGESLAAAVTRIATAHLESIGELHSL
jgi:hypothetical protein